MIKIVCKKVNTAIMQTSQKLSSKRYQHTRINIETVLTLLCSPANKKQEELFFITYKSLATFDSTYPILVVVELKIKL